MFSEFLRLENTSHRPPLCMSNVLAPRFQHYPEPCQGNDKQPACWGFMTF